MNAIRDHLRGSINLECAHYCQKVGLVGTIDRNELFAKKTRKVLQPGIGNKTQ